MNNDDRTPVAGLPAPRVTPTRGSSSRGSFPGAPRPSDPPVEERYPASSAAERLSAETQAFSRCLYDWLLSTAPSPEVVLAGFEPQTLEASIAALQAAFPALLVRSVDTMDGARELTSIHHPAVVVLDIPADHTPTAQIAADLSRVPHLILSSRVVPKRQLMDLAERVRAVVIPRVEIEAFTQALVQTIRVVYPQALAPATGSAA